MALPVLTALASGGRAAKASAATVVVLAMVFAFFQLQFNSRPFLLRYDLISLLHNSGIADGPGHDYLHNVSDLRITAEFNKYLSGEDQFTAIDQLLAKAGVDPKSKSTFRSGMNHMYPCNFHFQFMCELVTPAKPVSL